MKEFDKVNATDLSLLVWILAKNNINTINQEIIKLIEKKILELKSAQKEYSPLDLS